MCMCESSACCRIWTDSLISIPACVCVLLSATVVNCNCRDKRVAAQSLPVAWRQKPNSTRPPTASRPLPSCALSLLLHAEFVVECFGNQFICSVASPAPPTLFPAVPQPRCRLVAPLVLRSNNGASDWQLSTAKLAGEIHLKKFSARLAN